MIRTRRSIRRYQERPVPVEMLLEAIDTAAWAPSSGGKQGWMFHLVTSPTLIERVADAVEAKTELLASWPESAPYAADIERWRRNDAFFRTAPAIIAVTMKDYQSVVDRIARARGESDPAAVAIIESRQIGASRLQTVGGVVAYLLLALHQMGLGSCWMAGPLQAKPEIEQLLQIPPDEHFVALLPVGWPDESPEPRPHKSLEEMVRILS